MNRLAFLLLFCASLVRAESVSVVLDEVPLVDLVKLVYGEIVKRPYVLFPAVLEARQPVTVAMRDVRPAAVVGHLGRLLDAAGFRVEDRAGVVVIDKAQPAVDEIVVYRPRYRSARYLADVVQPLTGARSLLQRDLRTMDVAQGATPLPPSSGQAKSGRPDESRTSVAGMTDKGEVDQVAFVVPAHDVGKVRKLLDELDTPTGEVLLKAAVYEVGTSRQDGSAVKLALSLAGIQAGIGKVVEGGASIKLAAGGMEALFTALDSDTRFRSISKPQVRVKNGFQARFGVGQDVPVLGAAQIDKAGNPVQSVDYKQSGIILTARPEIRESVIELDLTQELSNFIATSTGVNNSPTLIKRSVNTRLSIQPGEVVILAGLQDEKRDESASRVPFLGWLMGSGRQDQQSEILVFIEAHKI